MMDQVEQDNTGTLQERAGLHGGCCEKTIRTQLRVAQRNPRGCCTHKAEQ